MTVDSFYDRIHQNPQNEMNPQMNTKSKLIVLDQDAVEILVNKNLLYKPYLLRLTNYGNERYEMRLSGDDLRVLTDLFNNYLEDITNDKC